MPMGMATFKDRVDSCVNAVDMTCDPTTTSLLSGWYLPPVKQEYGDVTDYDSSGSFVVSSTDIEEPASVCYHVQVNNFVFQADIQ